MKIDLSRLVAIHDYFAFRGIVENLRRFAITDGVILLYANEKKRQR